MNTTDKNALQRNHVYLMENLEAEHIIDELYSKKILSANDYEEIRVETTSRRKTAKLLSILPRRGVRAFQEFLDALQKDWSFIADQLREPINNNHSTNGTNGTSARFTQVGENINVPQTQVTPLMTILKRNESLVACWKDVGRGLQVQETQLTNIGYNERNTPQEMLHQTILAWLRSQGSNARLREIVEVVEEMGETGTAEELVQYSSTLV